MRAEIITVLGAYFDEDVSKIDQHAIQDIERILRDNLLTSFKNGLDAGKKPRKNSARK